MLAPPPSVDLAGHISLSLEAHGVLYFNFYRWIACIQCFLSRNNKLRDNCDPAQRGTHTALPPLVIHRKI